MWGRRRTLLQTVIARMQGARVGEKINDFLLALVPSALSPCNQWERKYNNAGKKPIFWYNKIIIQLKGKDAQLFQSEAFKWHANIVDKAMVENFILLVFHL